jgi:polyglutamine-binding protein 1
MPLPPALAARLAKRGILKPAVAENEPVEEVIAEDYDDRHEVPLPDHATHKSANIDESSIDNSHTPMEQWDSNTDELVHEVPLCPNCSNPYHTCSDYCRQRWGFKRFKADDNSLPGRNRLLRRFPLPAGWLEVGDPETGRYYYWNAETDEVCWLSPEHPRAVITFSVDKLKELSGEMPVAPLGPSQELRGRESDDDDDASTDLDDENYPDEDEMDLEAIERELKRKAQSERDRGKDHRRGRGRVDDSLDPMDPAAYSDVPRGSWSTGLEMRDSAKTGADVTAAGPLFQQRPYPSPGAVLRMNKDKK